MTDSGFEDPSDNSPPLIPTESSLDKDTPLLSPIGTNTTVDTDVDVSLDITPNPTPNDTLDMTTDMDVDEMTDNNAHDSSALKEEESNKRAYSRGSHQRRFGSSIVYGIPNGATIINKPYLTKLENNTSLQKRLIDTLTKPGVHLDGKA